MEHFLESLEKLKKPSTHSNPEDIDPLFCRYNKGWNDAIEKVEKLFCSSGLSDAWIPVDVKLPPEPKPNKLFDGLCIDIYLTMFEMRNGLMVGSALWNGKVFSNHTFTDGGAIAWMPLPESYKEEKHE